MEELKTIILNNINDIDNIGNYEKMEDDLSAYVHDVVTQIEIDGKTFYIIALQCSHCDEYYYFLTNDVTNVETIKDNEFEFNNTYGLVCNNCIDNVFYHCDCCGDLTHEDDYYYFNDEVYCQECYEENVTTCDCCGCAIDVNDVIQTANGEGICNDCFCNEYFTCENCNEVYHENYLNEHNGYYYCDDCYEEIEKDNEFDYYNTTNRDNINIDKPLKEYCNCNAVSEYHDNPIAFTKRSCNNEQSDLFFGVELEITNKENKTAQASHFIANNLYCRIESDSSIPYNGFEIISDPMTLNKWFERKEKIKQVFEELTNNNYISHNADNCGLHIHASREGLGDTREKQEKTIENMILICENFKEELKIFSRRNCFKWCRFLNDKDDERKREKRNEHKKYK